MHTKMKSIDWRNRNQLPNFDLYKDKKDKIKLTQKLSIFGAKLGELTPLRVRTWPNVLQLLHMPPQDPTSPEAEDLHSRLVQYRRQQSKNEKTSDYNLLKTVLRFCPILICPFWTVHSIFTSYSYFPFLFPILILIPHFSFPPSDNWRNFNSQRVGTWS